MDEDKLTKSDIIAIADQLQYWIDEHFGEPTEELTNAINALRTLAEVADDDTLAY